MIIEMSPLVLSSLVYLCVSVEGIKQLHLYVNRVQLRYLTVDESRHSSALERYPYLRGDEVDVSCVRLTPCALTLLFHFHEELAANGSMTEVARSSAGPQVNIVGMRVALQAAHDGGRATCECVGSRYNTTITVTFILQDTIHELINLKINSYPVRLPASSTSNLSIAVYYLWNETLSVEGQPASSEVVLQMVQYKEASSPAANCSDTSMKVKPGSVHSLLYAAWSHKTGELLGTVYMVFEQYYIGQNAFSPLVVNAGTPVLQLYDLSNERLYVYNAYEAGDAPTLTCSLPAGPALQYKHALYFGDAVSRNTTSITRHIQLCDRPENRTDDCWLLDESNNRTVKRTRLLWRQRTATNTLTAGGQWVTAGACVATCIVVCVCVAVCVRRHKRRSTKGTATENTEQQLCDNETPMSTHPPQWESKSPPQGQSPEEPLYSQVMKRGDTRRPSGQRVSQSSGQKPEIVYAVLDIAPFGQGPKRLHNEESPYAQVFSGASVRSHPAELRQ